MNKILVNVIVPEINKKYEVFIPVNIKFHSIISLFSRMLKEETSNMFPYSDRMAFFHYEKGYIINSDLNSKELGLKNGDKLIIM